MGSFLSGILGTQSQVGVSGQNPYETLQGWQDTAKQLAQQLQTQAAGGGPNPAQLQFQQNAQQLAQQQASQYAANRALNPEAAARLSGQNAAQLSSQAAGNAAVLQAQQQLAAQQELGQLSAQQQQALNQAGTINAQVAGANQGISAGLVGGALQGLSGGSINILGAQPKPLPGADGGFVTSKKIMPPHLHEIQKIFHPHMAHGGKVDAVLSPGEKYLAPNEAKKVADGKKSIHSEGVKIPGKALVKGDSLKNDIVPAQLEEGGVVIPRSVMHSDNPEKEAAKFVAKALQEHRGSPEGEFREALKRAIAGRKTK